MNVLKDGTHVAEFVKKIRLERKVVDYEVSSWIDISPPSHAMAGYDEKIHMECKINGPEE